MAYTFTPGEIDKTLAESLPAGSLYAVGGRVRDELRREIEGANVDLKDLDYVVTGLPIPDLEKRLKALGRVDLVGASFSVLKVTIKDSTVDIALPRRERSLGTGHREFEVESGPDISLDEDLGRRDFRMNMIARALPSGETTVARVSCRSAKWPSSRSDGTDKFT